MSANCFLVWSQVCYLWADWRTTKASIIYFSRSGGFRSDFRVVRSCFVICAAKCEIWDLSWRNRSTVGGSVYSRYGWAETGSTCEGSGEGTTVWWLGYGAVNIMGYACCSITRA